MKKFFAKFLAVVSALSILICNLSIIASATELNNGNILKFGSYPKSLVSDNRTLSELNADTSEWTSYGYYEAYTQTDNMLFKDLYYHGNKYRGVKIEKYRPYNFSLVSNENHTKQDENSYFESNIYWFLYEPIEWLVLDGKEGLLIAKDVIDSQPYNEIKGYSDGSYISTEGYFANRYEMSYIRYFLNEYFLNTAFSEEQKSQIIKGDYEANAHDCIYSSPCVSDYIVLPSYCDVLNPNYGFSQSAKSFDVKRLAYGTEYAKCQGLYVYSDYEHKGMSHWLLRTAGYYSDEVCYVLGDGSVRTDRDVVSSYIGIRPMMRVKLDYPFTDIELGSWYTPSVLWSYDMGIMNGTSQSTFSPNEQMTRAMFVTILAKLSGEDIQSIPPSGVFCDVETGSWYEKAVEWARLNSITSGTQTNLFSPNAPITREQLAVMLCAYAEYKGYDTESDTTIYEYSDNYLISTWAYDSVKWALFRSILSGNENKQVMPKETATRSQAAVIVNKFFNNYK